MSSQLITRASCTLILLSATSALVSIIISVVLLVPGPWSIHSEVIHYSYIGEDYPDRTQPEPGPVEITFEESVRYQLGVAETRAEFLALSPIWTNQGYVRLGNEHRLFLPAMFHQLHCIHGLAMVFQHPVNASSWHDHHCFNYLRRLFLCSADTTLEPYDSLTRDYAAHPVGITRECRNWAAMYQFADENYVAWMDFADAL